MKIVITSGYFNPIHSGHISYLNEAKKLGDRLFVIVNNDEQVTLKGSKEFMDEKERQIIIDNLKSVDYSMISNSKNRSIAYDFYTIRNMFPNDDLYFAKGGDRSLSNLPQEEIDECKINRIKMIFDVGESKTTSSSELLRRVS